jgi:DNA-binding PadR family transcriptional regulator
MTRIIVCPNPDCKEYAILAELYPAWQSSSDGYQHIDEGRPIKGWLLKPQTPAIPQPDYIPEAIRNDYEEACSILTTSPKASATLSRRCLQGMIRDFWKIKKSNLYAEIEELKQQGKVNISTMEAIDAVRKICNIGAHMEKEINFIIDIEKDEADILIKLLEDLFQDWYVARYEREKRNEQIIQIATSKKTVQTGPV